MELLFSFFMILVGLGALIYSADRLVEGSSSLARQFSVSEIAIGLTVISFGTSAPELTVNVLAVFKNESEIVFGNMIGSNLMNLLLVLGASAIIQPWTIKKNTFLKEIPLLLIAILIFLVFANDSFINNKSEKNALVQKPLFFLFFSGHFYGMSSNCPETTIAKNIQLLISRYGKQCSIFSWEYLAWQAVGIGE